MMEREKLIDFIIEAVEAIEDTLLPREYFKDYSQERLEEEAEWLDYLLGK